MWKTCLALLTILVWDNRFSINVLFNFYEGVSHGKITEYAFLAFVPSCWLVYNKSDKIQTFLWGVLSSSQFLIANLC